MLLSIVPGVLLLSLFRFLPLIELLVEEDEDEDEDEVVIAGADFELFG